MRSGACSCPTLMTFLEPVHSADSERAYPVAEDSDVRLDERGEVVGEVVPGSDHGVEFHAEFCLAPFVMVVAYLVSIVVVGVVIIFERLNPYWS